jgi:hypothetical protein
MLVTGKQESLKKGLLDFRKLKDVNFETHNEGAVIRYLTLWRHVILQTCNFVKQHDYLMRAIKRVDDSQFLKRH